MVVYLSRKIFIYMENTSITIKDDYLMIMYNPVLEKYDYQMYHVLDICEIEGKQMVNIQYRDENDHLSRVVMPHEKFLALVITKILIPLL
tara:strand:+ start:206 stop:475 length:270 start_codon:yes stop_codon:yes gene_type:complete